MIIYIFIHTHIYTYTHIHIYIYTHVCNSYKTNLPKFFQLREKSCDSIFKINTLKINII